MKILMVTSEAVPFAKTGGLADAVSALSLNLKKLGHDVRIVMPRYYKIDRSKLKPIDAAIKVHAGTEPTWVKFYESALPGSKVPVYFIDHEGCYGRDGIYGTKWDPDFGDNPYRSAVLCHGAFELCRYLGWYPDVMHAHDWFSCLVPVLLKHVCRNGYFAHTSSVLTIHNLGYQGVYSKDKFPALGLDWNLYYGAGLEHNGALNLLQAGISTADMITTVSPTYAWEMSTAEGGFGLDGLIRVRSDAVRGVLNGCDLDTWNPKTDQLLPANFDYKDLSGKAKCKKELQSIFGLPEVPNLPVVGMVTRLADQKGIAEVFAANYGCLYSLCNNLGLQFVLLGSGEKWCEDEINSLQAKLPNFKAKIGYDEKLSHLIEAGSDFFLMPSRYEPCGLNQMYSMLYGTLPIVRRTGGLADTVEQYNEQTGEGTGFLFDNLTPGAIYDTVGWAMYAYYNKPEHIAKMQKKGMQKNFSWEQSVNGYLDVYSQALMKGCGIDTKSWN